MVVALDVSEEYVSTGRPSWDRAGVAQKVEVRIGPALASLDAMVAAGEECSFDFAFIDADKALYDAYYERCLRLIRPGGVVAVDNTLWHGRVLDEADRSADTEAIRAMNRKLVWDARITICMLGIADGVTLCRKR